MFRYFHPTLTKDVHLPKNGLSYVFLCLRIRAMIADLHL